SASPATTFSFVYSGIQGRTISFTNDKGATFSYGCADCSFTVSESGISDATINSGPGIEFKLSADSSALTLSCRAVTCFVTNLATNSPGGWQQPPNMHWNAKSVTTSTITLNVTDLLSLPVDSTTAPAGNKQPV